MRGYLIPGLLLFASCTSPVEDPRHGLWSIGGVSDTEALKAFTILRDAGIAAEEGDGNLGITEVLVPENDVRRAVVLMAEFSRNASPRRFWFQDDFSIGYVANRLYAEQCEEGKRAFLDKRYPDAIAHYTAAVNVAVNDRRAALQGRARAYSVWGREDLADVDRREASNSVEHR